METPKIFHSNINKIQNESKNVTKQSEQEISEYTKDFIEKISNSDTETIVDFLENQTQKLPSRKKDCKLYRFNGILLVRSNGENAYELENNLKLKEVRDITPKFVNYFELGKNDFLTVAQINHDNITPYSEAFQNVKDEAKQKFKTCLQNMVNKGYINKEIFASKDSYFVAKDNKKIIFADWTKVSNLSPEEKLQMIQKLKEWNV